MLRGAARFKFVCLLLFELDKEHASEKKNIPPQPDTTADEGEGSNTIPTLDESLCLYFVGVLVVCKRLFFIKKQVQ